MGIMSIVRNVNDILAYMTTEILGYLFVPLTFFLFSFFFFANCCALYVVEKSEQS
jgi:hypothetical protein